MKAQGIVHKYGDNVDTDVIIPARHLNTADHKELASHCMEDIDTDFVNKVKQGRHHGRRRELRLRIIQRTCADRYQGKRHRLRHRKDFCTDLLQKCHQHRTADPGMSGSQREDRERRQSLHRLR